MHWLQQVAIYLQTTAPRAGIEYICRSREFTGFVTSGSRLNPSDIKTNARKLVFTRDTQQLAANNSLLDWKTVY